MRDMHALLGAKKTPHKPNLGPMPMIGGAPPSKPPFLKKAAVGDTAAPGDTGAGPDAGAGETKMSPEKALVSHADENCGNCTNFSADSGECSEVDGTFQPDDRCWAAYSPSGGDSGTATDSITGEPDNATVDSLPS